MQVTLNMHGMTYLGWS